MRNNNKKNKSNEEEEKNEKSQWENKRKIKGTCRLDRLILYTAIAYGTELTNLGGFIVIVSSTIRCDVNFTFQLATNN